MSTVNIHGNYNELNAILNSKNSNVVDSEDVSGNTITGTATVDISTVSLNYVYTFEVSGNYHDITTIYDSSASTLTDGDVVSENGTIVIDGVSQ